MLNSSNLLVFLVLSPNCRFCAKSWWLVKITGHFVVVDVISVAPCIEFVIKEQLSSVWGFGHDITGVMSRIGRYLNCKDFQLVGVERLRKSVDNTITSVTPVQWHIHNIYDLVNYWDLAYFWKKMKYKIFAKCLHCCKVMVLKLKQSSLIQRRWKLLIKAMNYFQVVKSTSCKLEKILSIYEPNRASVEYASEP